MPFDSFSISHATERGKKNIRREIQILIFFTLAPLVLAFLGTFYFDGVVETINKIFLGGDLYYYSVSIASSIFIVTQLNGHKSLYAMKMWSAVFVVLTALLLAFYIGQSPIIEYFPEHKPIFNGIHALMSVIIFISAFIVYFRVRLLADEPPPPPGDVNRDSVDEHAPEVGDGYD
jgi:hypothetical protein